MTGPGQTVVSIKNKIEASMRAFAVDRAWEVAKVLERDRQQIANLRWVEPVTKEGRVISRTIDLEHDFPPGVTSILPLPVDLSVIAPASLLVPGEDLRFSWSMPLLIRTRPAEPLPGRVRSELGWFCPPSTRHIIEVVTFLPFPRVGAPPEEQFNPQFFITLDFDKKVLGSPDNYIGAIVCFGDKVVRQIITSERTFLAIVADPQNTTPFKAEMLVSMTDEELAATSERAGTIDIFVYRSSKLVKDLYSKIISLTEEDSEAHSQVLSQSLSLVDGPKSCENSPSLSRTCLTSIPGGGQKPKLPPPSAVQKEVGDTAISEGTRGERVKIHTLDGYCPDPLFPVQQISIRVLGVREGAREALIRTLESVGSQ